MSCALLRSLLLRTGTAIAVACTSTVAFANFKYIPASPASDSAAAPAAPVTSSPLGSAPGYPAGGTAMSSPAASQPMSGGEVISGFGTQVPLVMALREIVPSSYQFAFADGLNLGTLVNWKGGRPWRDVLRSVATPLGLTATERNAVIYIDHADTGSVTR